jgi:hypothetical protein
MTDFILKKLETGWETPEYRWSAIILGIVKSPAFLMQAPRPASN